MKVKGIINCMAFLLVIIILITIIPSSSIAASIDISNITGGFRSDEVRNAYGLSGKVWQVNNTSQTISFNVLVNSMGGYAVYRVVPRVNGNIVNNGDTYISYTMTGSKYISCKINGGGDFSSYWNVSIGDFVDFIIYPYSSTSLPVSQPSGSPVALIFWKYTNTRADMLYSDTAIYREYMQYKMNCYGYAIHLFCPEGSISAPYKQQPGEFAQNTETYATLVQNQSNALVNGTANDFIKQCVYDDFATLSYYSTTEFTITSTTLQSIVPPGKRKIALVTSSYDYHFYVRHSDGTWSHKPGYSPITNLSFSGTPLTDSNIDVLCKENYPKGTQYFLIGKSGVVDFPHFYGHDPSTTYTTVDFRDMAGDNIAKSFTITNSWNSRFDYPGDKDYFRFTPTSSGMYTISTNCDSYHDIDGAIYDSQGNIIISDYTSSNANFSVYLSANTTYYIYMYDYKKHTDYYVLWCYK